MKHSTFVRAFAIVGILGIVLAGLLLLHTDPFSLLASYRAVSSARIGAEQPFLGYLWWSDAPWEAPSSIAALAPLVVALFLAVRTRGARFHFALVLLSALAMFAAWVTDHEFKMSATPPFIAASAIALLSPEATVSPRSIRALLATSLAILSVYAGKVSIRRERVFAVGAHRFFDEGPLVAVETPAFFRGVLAAPVMPEVLGEIDAVLRAHGLGGRADARVFFGPRLEFGYPAWGINPVRGRPLLWNFFPDGAPRTQDALRDFAASPPELCILLGGKDDDMESWPPSLRSYLAEHSDSRVEGSLRILERR